MEKWVDGKRCLLVIFNKVRESAGKKMLKWFLKVWIGLDRGWIKWKWRKYHCFLQTCNTVWMRCQGSKAVQTGAHLWIKLQAETNLIVAMLHQKLTRTQLSNSLVEDKKARFVFAGWLLTLWPPWLKFFPSISAERVSVSPWNQNLLILWRFLSLISS